MASSGAGVATPTRPAWCEAVDAIDLKLAPGSYTFTTARRRVCQNSGSNGMGFIRVTARAGLAGPGAYPGQEGIQPSQPATPELTAEPTTNLALGKPAQQSSTYSGDYPASNGVDGRKDNASMFHTGIREKPLVAGGPARQLRAQLHHALQPHGLLQLSASARCRCCSPKMGATGRRFTLTMGPTSGNCAWKPAAGGRATCACS